MAGNFALTVCLPSSVMRLAVDASAAASTLIWPRQPKHWPPEDTGGLRGGQPCAVVEGSPSEDDHVCAADLVDGCRQHTRRADGVRSASVASETGAASSTPIASAVLERILLGDSGSDCTGQSLCRRNASFC